MALFEIAFDVVFFLVSLCLCASVVCSHVSYTLTPNVKVGGRRCVKKRRNKTRKTLWCKNTTKTNSAILISGWCVGQVSWKNGLWMRLLLSHWSIVQNRMPRNTVSQRKPNCFKHLAAGSNILLKLFRSITNVSDQTPRAWKPAKHRANADQQHDLLNSNLLPMLPNHAASEPKKTTVTHDIWICGLLGKHPFCHVRTQEDYELIELLQQFVPFNVLVACQVCCNGHVLPLSTRLNDLRAKYTASHKHLQTFVLRLLPNPLRGGAPSIAEACVEFRENQTWLKTKAEYPNLEKFVMLWNKKSEKGDVNSWRTLAAAWGIRRDKLDIMKTNCSQHFLNRMRLLLADAPKAVPKTCAEAINFFQQNSLRFQSKAQEANMRKFVDLQSKAVERGDADEWKKLGSQWGIQRNKLEIMKDQISETFVKFVQAECVQATAVSSASASSSRSTQDPMDRLPSSEEPGKEPGKASAASQTPAAIETAAKPSSKNLQRQDLSVDEPNPTETKLKRARVSNSDPERKRKLENTMPNTEGKRQNIMQLLLSQKATNENPPSARNEDTSLLTPKKQPYWWKRTLFKEWNRLRGLDDVNPQLKKRLFAAANHSTDKGLSKEIRQDHLWWRTADLSNRLTTRKSRTRFVTEFLHYELSVCLLGESMQLGNPQKESESLLHALPIKTQDFVAALKANQNFLPFGYVSKTAAFVKPSTSQFFRHIALIELPTYGYTELPLDPQELHLLLCQSHDARCANQKTISTDKELQMEVLAHLQKYVAEPFNLNANMRFLCGNAVSEARVQDLLQELGQ